MSCKIWIYFLKGSAFVLTCNFYHLLNLLNAIMINSITFGKDALFMWIVKLVRTHNVEDEDQYELRKCMPHSMYSLVVLSCTLNICLLYRVCVYVCVHTEIERLFISQLSVMTDMVNICLIFCLKFLEGC